MDFYAETERIKQRRLGKIGSYTYEYWRLAKQIEMAQKRMSELDIFITQEEAAIEADSQAQKNFNSYLAVKENAVTIDQVKEAVETGKDIKD